MGFNSGFKGLNTLIWINIPLPFYSFVLEKLIKNNSNIIFPLLFFSYHRPYKNVQFYSKTEYCKIVGLHDAVLYIALFAPLLIILFFSLKMVDT